MLRPYNSIASIRNRLQPFDRDRVYDSAGKALPARSISSATQSTPTGDPTNTWDTYLFVGKPRRRAPIRPQHRRRR
jgi:hypothetical protein